MMMKTNLQRTVGRKWVKWGEVVRIAREAGIGVRFCADVIRAEARAKMFLPGRKKPVYVRCVVLELLGLSDEPAGHGKS